MQVRFTVAEGNKTDLPEGWNEYLQVYTTRQTH